MSKKLIGSAVALALILVPVGAARAYVPGGGGGSIDSATVAACETVTYSAPAGTFLPDEETTESISGVSGDKITLASAVSSATWNKPAAGDGSLSFSLTMPHEAGKDYVLRVESASGGVADRFTIHVIENHTGSCGDAAGVGDPSGASNGGGLARTGATVALSSGIVAAVLVALGIVFMILRRRRSGGADAAS